MKTSTIRQKVTFRATPHEVYETLMDSRKHSKLTGGKCSISRKVGGRFNVFDGYATGKNVELVPDEKIVQLWRAQEDCWPPDHHSKVTFTLKPVKEGTQLSFVQTGIPADCGDMFVSGWKENYWVPMKEMLEAE